LKRPKGCCFVIGAAVNSTVHRPQPALSRKVRLRHHGRSGAGRKPWQDCDWQMKQRSTTLREVSPNGSTRRCDQLLTSWRVFALLGLHRCARLAARLSLVKLSPLDFENRQGETITTTTGIAVAMVGVRWLTRSRDQRLNETTLECCGGREQASPPPAPGLRAPEDVDLFPRKTAMSCNGERDYRSMA
jgi:hypothetical protein